jgi:hypothetical protein
LEIFSEETPDFLGGFFKKRQTKCQESLRLIKFSSKEHSLQVTSYKLQVTSGTWRKYQFALFRAE